MSTPAQTSRTRSWATIAVVLPPLAAYAVAPLLSQWISDTVWSHVYWGVAYASSGFAAYWFFRKATAPSLKAALALVCAACFVMTSLYALSGYGDRYFHSAVSAARRGDFERAESLVQASIDLHQQSPVEVGKGARLGWGGLVSDARINGWLMLGNEALKARHDREALFYYVDARDAADALGERETGDWLQEQINWLAGIGPTGGIIESEE